MTLPLRAPAPTRLVHHVGIAVNDLEAAIQRYRELFGLEAGEIIELEERGVRGCFIPVGETNLELLQSTRPDGFIGSFVASRGQGLHHICFEAEGVGERLKALQELGVPLIDETPRLGLMGGLIGYLQPGAVNDVYVELAQHH